VSQYRGQILPLIRISHALEERREPILAELAESFPPDHAIQVLVLNHDSQLFGLVVPEILDIVEDAPAMQGSGHPLRGAVLGRDRQPGDRVARCA
jgi:chemotaxis signal transduction protein